MPEFEEVLEVWLRTIDINELDNLSKEYIQDKQKLENLVKWALNTNLEDVEPRHVIQSN